MSLLLAGLVASIPLRAPSAPVDSVALREDDATYTLDNGIVSARVAKVSGDLVSLRYKNMEMLATFLTPDGQPDLQRDPPGANPNGLNRGMTDHQYGFWSHDAMGPRGTDPAIARITIDPKSNGGERAEGAERQRHQHRQRQRPLLVLRGQDQEHHDHREGEREGRAAAPERRR